MGDDLKIIYCLFADKDYEFTNNGSVVFEADRLVINNKEFSDELYKFLKDRSYLPITFVSTRLVSITHNIFPDEIRKWFSFE